MRCLGRSVAGMILLGLGLAVVPAHGQAVPPFDASRPVEEVLAYSVSGDRLPGLAVAVLKEGQVVLLEAAGLRKRGDPAKVEVGDAFHIGSNTKAMTALLAATFVDQGRLRWSTKVAEVLPELAMRKDYEGLSLELLLSHASGLPDSLPAAQWGSFFSSGKPTGQERKRLAEAALALLPRSKPGTAFLYSNFNYVIAGLMLERLGGQSWENLVEERIFRPLGMASAGFGCPATPGSVDAPWGHNPAPVDPASPYADNPQALGPAGTVHANAADLLKYLEVYLEAGRLPGGQNLVSSGSLAQIEEPRLEGYGLGWISLPDPRGGHILVHDGSNTMFYSSLVAIPSLRLAVVVLCNRGDAVGSRLAQALREYLVGKYTK